MRRRRHKGIRWNAVLLLTAAFSVLAGSALLFAHRFPARMPPVPADPHAKPLDFADHQLRHALDEYAMFTLSHGLPAIAGRCGGRREVYRSAADHCDNAAMSTRRAAGFQTVQYQSSSDTPKPR